MEDCIDMVATPLIKASSLPPTFELTSQQREHQIDSQSRSMADLSFVSQALDAPSDEDEESTLPWPYCGA